jgi:TonB family protein
MKSFITVVLISASLIVFAQDTTYYDANMKKITNFESCVYYQVLTVDKNENNKAFVNTYYKSGKIKTEQTTFYKDGISRFNGGRIKELYENGQIRREYFYKTATALDGEVVSFYQNGKQKRKDLFKDGKLIEGHTFSQEGIEVPYTSFISDASYPGGNDELVRFILKNIKYPKKAKTNNIEGTVEVRFAVEANGDITDITVTKSIDQYLDDEAIRIVKKMPKWTPCIIDGETLTSYFILPISFAITGY